MFYVLITADLCPYEPTCTRLSCTACRQYPPPPYIYPTLKSNQNDPQPAKPRATLPKGAPLANA